MEKKEDLKSYRSAFKATSIFGGVQVFNILIGIIRSKFIAILLGPYGMGIAGLLTSTLTLLSSFTNCGLSVSAVRNIAEANTNNDSLKISLVIKIFRRLIWVTGILGSLICLITARYLSNVTFGNEDYAIAFRILSVSILFMQLTAGQNALLQGLRKYKDLALANVFGHSFALLVTLPMYYVWHLSAIVPSIIVMYVATFVVAYIFSRKIRITKVRIPKDIFLQEGGNMMKMGIFISLQGILLKLAEYIIRILIQREGGAEEVGLYTACFTIVNSYVGMVFTAMSTDFYPRLSGVASDSVVMNKVINQQMTISLLILAPIIALFFVFAKLGIQILYSNDFMGIEIMLYWAMSGVVFKAVGWSVAFSFLAKGDTKSFFFNELLSLAYFLVINILCYKLLGLDGLGISYMINYFVYMLQVLWVCRIKYSYRIENKTLKFIIFLVFILSFFIVSKLLIPIHLGNCLSIFLFVFLAIISVRKLNALLDLKQLIKDKSKRS